jgi:DNA-binding CsgD family transcriptional regulator
VLLAAAEAYHQLGYAVNRAQALEDAAVLLAQQGEATAARTAHTQAVDGYTALGAAWDIRRADTRLRAHGIRRGIRGPRSPHRRPVTGWQALTLTELTVAGLVAKGLSNPDIAAELFLSRRTVQSHVSHILTKLGAHSRVDIARTAAAHQPTPTTTADPPTPTT